MESQPQNPEEADFLWKVSLKILNSGIIMKTFTHGQQDTYPQSNQSQFSDYRNIGPLAMHRALIEYSDQTAWMCTLIRVFNGCTCQLEPFAEHRLNFLT